MYRLIVIELYTGNKVLHYWENSMGVKCGKKVEKVGKVVNKAVNEVIV
jgi:hypothetical protein